MPVCCYIKENGVKCTFSAERLPYFWFRDGFEMVSKEYKICFNHSQTVLGKLLEEENKIQITITTLRLKVKNLGQRKKICARCSLEIVDDFKECPRCQNNLYTGKKMIVIYDQDEKTKMYDKIKRLGGILNFARNRKCRLCGHPLDDPTCVQCKDRQWGDRYSHADFKTAKGYRRADVLFHIKCGRIWYYSITGIHLMPTSQGQKTLEDVLEV